MAKITEKTKQTETERQIELALDHFKMSLQAIADKTDLELYIQVRGVPIETLVQTSKEIKTAENCGIENNLTNHYVNLEFDNVHLSLNTLNEL
jgi:hypothetical protein